MQVEPVRVVVVDDVDDAAQSLALLLQLQGCNVATARCSEEAVVLIEDFNPHAVMLDVHMPGIDGFELASLLRHRYRDEMVLIAVTGHAANEPRVASTFAIVDHHFQKPVTAKQLALLLSAPKSELPP